MAYSQAIIDFAQQVRLTTHNRFVDDITSADGTLYVDRIVMMANLFFDELENLIDSSGRPVYWKYLREQGYNLGSAVSGANNVTIPANVKLIDTAKRYLLITVGGEVKSKWSVVDPDQVSNGEIPNNQKYVYQIGTKIYFSRSLTDEENGGVITADVVAPIPHLGEVDGDDTHDEALSIIVPQQLLVLGVAKNVTLPDIVQGGLSPSYVQKYNDLLQSSIAINQATSQSDVMERDDFSYIGGV